MQATKQLRNADVDKPDEIKALIAQMQTGNAYRRMFVQVYNRYVKYYKLQWEASLYKVTSKEITVPTDEKIQMLIAVAKKPLSTKLELSYKTGVRPVEVCKLRVKDLNKDSNTINPQTAKNGNPRKLTISAKLSGLLTEQYRNTT
ncbi:MAG: tyrosine-type recombinase/integrase [Candidatus Bathyarchaeia archaeon]